MVLRDSIGMVGFGVLVGVAVAQGVARLLEASLFEVESIDPFSANFALAMLLQSHLNALMDQAPDCLPARQLPLTTVCSACSKRSANRASALS